jgi:hypothetical protein
MKEAGMLSEGTTEAAFLALGRDHWSSVFKVDRMRGKQRWSFTGTIDTDGTAMCAHFVSPKLVDVEPAERSERCYDPKKYRVLGVDPGRSNILSMAEPLEAGGHRSFMLTRRQYYAEAGIYQANAWSAIWSKGVAAQVEALSAVSPKGASLAGFLLFMKNWFAVRGAIFHEFAKPRWAQQRLRLYGGKQRVFARFLNRVEAAANDENDCRQTVLAYGSAKFAPGGKGEVAVPTSRAFKECAKRFHCQLVSEFRTSQTFYENGVRLEKVAVALSDPKLAGAQGPAEAGRRRVAVVRGLLWCGSTSDNGKFVNRDVNAALNIRNCAVKARRPVWLDRAKNPTPLPPQRIVKFITC